MSGFFYAVFIGCAVILRDYNGGTGGKADKKTYKQIYDMACAANRPQRAAAHLIPHNPRATGII